MATAESAAKVCVVCGANVAGKPRVKDAAGRYMCAGECQEKAEAQARARAQAREQAKLQPPPPPKKGPVVKSTSSPGDGNLLGDLISNSPMVGAVACTACGNPMPNGAVVCTRCGFNSQTGKNLKTAVIREKEKKEPKVKPLKYSNKYAYQSGPSFWKALMVYTCALSVVSLLVFAGPLGVFAARVIFMLAGLAAWVTCVISAFKNDQTLFGILNIIPIVNWFSLLIFNLLFNEDTMSRALYWSLWIGGFVLGVMIGIAFLLGFNVDLLSSSLSPRG
jgi:hypothetical protein